MICYLQLIQQLHSQTLLGTQKKDEVLDEKLLGQVEDLQKQLKEKTEDLVCLKFVMLFIYSCYLHIYVLFTTHRAKCQQNYLKCLTKEIPWKES